MLSEGHYERPIVLGISPGGVVVAAEIAKVLAADLGAVVAKKLEAPFQPELTIGAVTATGVAYVDSILAEEIGANQHYLADQQRRQAQAAKQRQETLGVPSSEPFDGRDVLVVTDGLTTGARAVAVTRHAQDAGAPRVIVAAPVAAPDACKRLRHEAAEVVCLFTAPGFLSVGQFYDDFPAIDDDDIRLFLGNRQPA